MISNGVCNNTVWYDLFFAYIVILDLEVMASYRTSMDPKTSVGCALTNGILESCGLLILIFLGHYFRVVCNEIMKLIQIQCLHFNGPKVLYSAAAGYLPQCLLDYTYTTNPLQSHHFTSDGEYLGVNLEQTEEPLPTTAKPLHGCYICLGPSLEMRVQYIVKTTDEK